MIIAKVITFTLFYQQFVSNKYINSILISEYFNVPLIYSLPITTHHCHPNALHPMGILDHYVPDWFWNIVISFHVVQGVSWELWETSWFLGGEINKKVNKKRPNIFQLGDTTENWIFFSLTCIWGSIEYGLWGCNLLIFLE